MRHWNWRVNLESRQLIQSLLVVMSVIPNALFEAICIQKCNLPGIDGKVPLKIIEELVKLLQEMVVPVQPSPLPTLTHTFSFAPDDVVGAVFLVQGFNYPIAHPLEIMLDDIMELKAYLVEDDDLHEDFMPQAQLLLPMCDDMRTMCDIYLHFVSLVWQRTNSNGNFNPAENELAHSRTFAIVHNEPQCLLRDFLDKYKAEFGPAIQP